jgi:hypothetical protein
MKTLSIMVREGESPVLVDDAASLLRLLASVAADCKKIGRLTIIDAKSEGGDILSLVVGGEETVLGFTSGANRPPYFASRGTTIATEPTLSCYLHFEHLTEFPRHAVIPQELGTAAALQFLHSGELPSCVQWQEV